MAQRNGARHRGDSVQYLDNKSFAYLLNKGNNPNTASSYTTIPPLKQDADSNKTIDTLISPRLKNGGMSSSNGSTKGKSKADKKKKFRKHRTSSIQVETTKTQNEQLNAIKKEVESLTKEVPGFADYYAESQQIWKMSKRNKAESEAFALIQGLTQWIHNYGNPAVKEFVEFKQSAEAEIINMVTKVENLTHQNQELNLIIEEHENQKHELQTELQQQERQIIKYRKDEQDRSERVEVQQSNQKAIDALEKEIEKLRNENKAMSEKYERVDKYWKMTQSENAELFNRNAALEEEVNNLKDTVRSNNTNMQSMQVKHQRIIRNLQMEHQSLAEEMKSEQEKLIQAQQEQQRLIPTITHTPTVDLGYTIDIDDTDIKGSGITDDVDDDGDGDFETMGGIVSLENEINVYEYEDDEWLDESDSDLSPEPEIEPEPEPEPEPTPEPEEYNKQIEFEMVKESHYQDIERRDISAEFKMTKMSFGQDTMEKTSGFTMQSQRMSQKRIILVEEKEESPEPMQFESEKMKIDVPGKPKEKKMEFTMSSTQISHTPQQKSPDASKEFESEKKFQSMNEINEKKPMEFSSESTGAMGQKNELIHKNNVPKPLKKVIYIEREPKKDDKLIMGGKNFSERLAMFKHLEETRGGKPKVLESSKAYALINKWKTQNANNDELKSNPLNKITKPSGNLHVTKATVHSIEDSKNRTKNINVLKITKTKAHTLKPRLMGYMNIIRSSFIPRWKMTQQPRYFFVLDGLPSETNVNEKEPDFAKNRKHDSLVPTLFFFQDKDDYDEFAAKVKDLPTRDVKFQRLFAEYAKGTFPLHTFAMDINISGCVKRLHNLLKRDNIKFPNSEINQTGTVDKRTILVCSTKEIHRFSCNDTSNRDKWVKKVNKLVDRRAQRLQNINNGLLGISSAGTGVRKSVADGGGDETPVGQQTPVSVIGTPVGGNNNYSKSAHTSPFHGPTTRNTRGSSMYVPSVSTVEKDFD